MMTDVLLSALHDLMRQHFRVPVETVAGTCPSTRWSDGRIAIPRAGDPARVDWDRRFVEAVLAYFGTASSRYEAVVVPTSEAVVVHANGVRNYDRYDLYRAILGAGEPAPPIYVEPLGASFYIKDGNHRTYAARAVGVTHLVGICARP